MANPSNAPLELKQLLNTPEPADLGPRRRARTLTLEKLDEQIRRCVGATPLPKRSQELIRGTLLLWHDHLDAAHAIAQDVESGDGSLLHAILHRREPDYWNSKYWFRRVGEHPCYLMIASRVAELLGPQPKELAAKIIPSGKWDPLAFVDACKEAAKAPQQDSLKMRLLQIQRIEFEALLDHLSSG